LIDAVITADRAGKVRVRYGQSTAEHAVMAGRSFTVTIGQSGLTIR